MPITKTMMLVTTPDKGEFVIESRSNRPDTVTLRRVDAFLKSLHPELSSGDLIQKQFEFIDRRKADDAVVSMEVLKSAGYEIIYI